MVVTDATFHLPISALNLGLFPNNSTMQLTPLTSQSAMLPYVVVATLGLVTHADTAVAMLLLVIAASVGAGVGLAVHTRSFVREPIEHALAPDSVYPWLQVGLHRLLNMLLCGRYDAHDPACPFSGAVDTPSVHGPPS
jgi:hypothetical protein